MANIHLTPEQWQQRLTLHDQDYKTLYRASLSSWRPTR